MNKNALIWFLLLGLTAALTSLGCAGTNSPGDSGVADADGGNPPSDEIFLCTSQQDCQANEDCLEGVCRAVGSCSCNSQCSKAGSEVCEHATGRCVIGAPPSQCSSGCDCYTGESCSGGTCVPAGGDQGGCQGPVDCPAAETCQGGACVPKGCTTRDDCAGATCQVCRNGLCSDPQAGCVGNNECCPQFHCNFGTCVPDASGCTSDSDCHDPAFPRCDTSTGACLPECTSDTDCQLPGQKCLSQKCVTPSCDPAQCSQGQWCDPSDGQCKPGCDQNSDCVAPQTCDYTTHQCGSTDPCNGLCNPATQTCNPTTGQCQDAARSPEAGELVISEYMADPSKVADSVGEWFEVYNPTADRLSLDGLIVHDDGTNTFTIPAGHGLTIASHGRLVLAINGDPTKNGGVTADYVYSNFFLGNSSDAIVIERTGVGVIDAVRYNKSAGWLVGTGKSTQLKESHLNATDNNVLGNWCQTTKTYGAGDYGTPGTANTNCAAK